MLLSLIALALGASSGVADSEFVVRPPIVYGNLAVFPVLTKTALFSRESRYITLDEGIRNKWVVVKETGEPPIRPMVRPRDGNLSDSRQRQSSDRPVQIDAPFNTGADVNKLKITNKSEKVLILLAGEMVVGGKQDRIVQKDCLVPPLTEDAILDVFCVERGRWDTAAKEFDTRAGGFLGNVANPSVRGTAQDKADQSAVWSSVGGVHARLGTNSPTGTLREAVANKKVQADLSGYLKEIESKMPADACGVVVAIDGNPVWADVFPSAPGLFAKYWPKLLRSYALDAVGSANPALAGPIKPVPVSEAVRFLSDRDGKSSFEGLEKVYKLRRTEGQSHVIFDLIDIGLDPERVLHTCKMLKKS